MVRDEDARALRTFVVRNRPVFVRQELVASRRLDGELDLDGRDARGFGAVLVYLQRGLGHRFDDVLQVLRAIHAGQSGYHIEYPVCLFSFGGGDGKLRHLGRAHTGNTRSDVTAWAKELCRLAGEGPTAPRIEITELLPWSHPVIGKRRVERTDLLVFFSSTREIAMTTGAHRAFGPSAHRRSIWVFLSGSDCGLELGTFLPCESGTPAPTAGGTGLVLGGAEKER